MLIEWTYTLAGALTGFIVGLTGVGGGALMAPILLLVFNVSITTVVATDLWFAAITKIAAARIYHTSGHIDWTVARRLWMGSIPASLIVIIALACGYISKIPGSVLQRSIGVLVLLTAFGLLISETLKKQKITFNSSALLKKIPLNTSKVRTIATIIAGGILGIIVTLTSVGAGVFGTLVLVYLYGSRMTPHTIVATDIMHAIPLALLAGMGYLLCGQVNGSLLLSLLVGSIPAAIIGATLAKKTNYKALKTALAIVMFLAGLKLVI